MESQSDRKPGLIKRVGGWFKSAGQAVAPGPRVWHWAAWGALVALTMILLVTAYGMLSRAAPARFLMGAVLFLAVFAL